MPQYYGYTYGTGRGYGYAPHPQPQPPRGRGCLRVLIAVLVIAVVLGVIVVFGGPLLARFGISGGLGGLLPSSSEESSLSQYDHARLNDELRDCYVYNQLDAQDQEKYRVMYEALVTRTAREFPYEGAEDLARIRNYIIEDHASLFYVTGVNAHTEADDALLSTKTVTTIEGIYQYDAEETARMQVQLDEAAAACLAGIPAGADDYERVKYLYEYIAENVEYDWNAYDVTVGGTGESVGQTAPDALVDRSALCAGYANAFQYLVQKLGMQCVYVTGTARGDAHAWIAVELDGQFYYIDPTWGDPQFVEEGGATAEAGRINYDYLCIPTEDILLDHAIDSELIVPSCASMADNYYVREGRYLDSADIDVAGAIIREAALSGEESVQMRCSSRSVYESLKAALFDGGGIYPYIPGDTCWYSANDDFCSITVIF